MDLYHQNLKKIEQLYEDISTDCLNEASDTAKQWERITRSAGRAIEREIVNPIAGGIRTVADYGGQAASGVVRGMTGGAVDLEKLGKSAEKMLGSGGKPTAEPKPAVLPRPQANVKQPPSADSGRSAGEYLAPSRGSSRAADPLVRQGGSYGFFGAIKPQAAKQPPTPVKPVNTKVKKDPRGAIIVNHFEVENDQLVSEAPAQVAPITGPGGKGWYQKDKEGKYVPITDPEKAKQAAARWKAHQDVKKLPDNKKKLPTVVSPADKLVVKTKPAPVPTRQPAPTRTQLSQSLKPAAQTGNKVADTATWAKRFPNLAKAQQLRSSGASRSDINKVLYKPGTAAYGASGQSEIEKKAQEIRATRERISKEGIKPIPVIKEETMTKDSYDLVLEYLLSTGHADTLLEAQYVMMQMSAEHIQNIVEAEVLAMKGGVPGSVKVKPALSIPGTDIGIGPNKPVPGTFTTTTPGQREKIAKGDTTIDRGTYQQSRVGAGPTSAERQRYNAELIKQGKHTAPRMSQ